MKGMMYKALLISDLTSKNDELIAITKEATKQDLGTISIHPFCLEKVDVKKLVSSVDLTHKFNDFDCVLIDWEYLTKNGYMNICSFVNETIRPNQKYIPVIVINNDNNYGFAIDCITAGIRAVVDIRDQLKTIKTIESLCQDYQLTKRRLNIIVENGTVLKSGGPDANIADQAEFLRSMQSYPAVSDCFPRIIDSWTDKATRDTYYYMPYYTLKSLRSVALQSPDQESCEEILKKFLTNVIDFIFDKLFSLKKEHVVLPGFVDRVFFGRFQARMSAVEKYLNEVLGDPKGINTETLGVFRALLDRKNFVRINDRLSSDKSTPYINPMVIMDELNADEQFVAAMTPPMLGIVHGDLHFKNILVNDLLLRHSRIIYIDPRGDKLPGYEIGTGDIAYDIGKLLMSSFGLYDLIDEGFISLESYGESVSKLSGDGSFSYQQLKFTHWYDHVMKSGATVSEMMVHRRMCGEWIQPCLHDIGNFIIEKIENKLGHDHEDKNWKFRAQFHSAVHLCSVAVLQTIKGKSNESHLVGSAICIRGVEMLNDFYSDYRATEFKD